MVEIELIEFEDFYKERLNTQFFKVKRAIKKIIEDLRASLIDIKLCMDRFLDSSDKIDQKSLRSLNLFSERVRNYVDEIEIPEDEDITYSNLNELVNSVKKLFKSINEIARKSLPKFQKKVQAEIKDLNYRTRKLQKKQVILDTFLRKKYGDIKNAEDLLKKLPKMFNLKENIENSKQDLEKFEKEVEEREKNQEKLNSELIQLEKNTMFKDLDEAQNKVFQLRLKINNEIGFKKALKKLKFELDKESIHISNFDFNYLRDFLKDSISVLSKENKDLPKFSSLLIHLRRTLEEGNKLNLKSDTKTKTIDQINNIFDQRMIHLDIEELRALKESVKEIEENIKDAGLASKLEDIKSQVSSNSLKLEHVQADSDRRNKDYLKYLAALKEERELFQGFITEAIQEDVKLNITFDF